MKLKKLFLISLMVLTVLMLSAVSATEDANDNLTVEMNDDLMGNVQDDELSIKDSADSNEEFCSDDSVLGKAPEFQPRIDDSPKVDEKGQVLWIEDIPSNANGQFKVSVNSKVVNTHVITKQDKLDTFNEGWTLKDLKITKSGTYSLMVKYVAKNDKTKVIAKYPHWKVHKAKAIKLTLNKITIKSSTEKVTLKSTLKLQGKLAKGKKITFKFNGKTYKAKTNKKGIAKVTVKKSVLDKIEVGKKVKYQASYGKKTVKRTVTMKN